MCELSTYFINLKIFRRKGGQEVEEGMEAEEGMEVEEGMEEEQQGEGVVEVDQPVEEEEAAEVVRVEIPNVNVVSHVSEGL